MRLEDFSPAAAMLTGKGALGKLISQGFGGALPAAIARSAQRDAAEEARQQALAESGQGQPMKKGGAVKAKGWGKARGARAAKVY